MKQYVLLLFVFLLGSTGLPAMEIEGAQYQKKFVCDWCSKLFARRDSLMRHINTLHEGEGYRCELCDRNFLTKELLVEHKENNSMHYKKMVIELERKRKLIMIEGAETVELHQDIKYQKKRAESKKVSKEKKFRCAYEGCDKCYTRQWTLNRHISSHHGAKECEGIQYDGSGELFREDEETYSPLAELRWDPKESSKVESKEVSGEGSQRIEYYQVGTFDNEFSINLLRVDDFSELFL